MLWHFDAMFDRKIHSNYKKIIDNHLSFREQVVHRFLSQPAETKGVVVGPVVQLLAALVQQIVVCITGMLN